MNFLRAERILIELTQIKRAIFSQEVYIYLLKFLKLNFISNDNNQMILRYVSSHS